MSNFVMAVYSNGSAAKATWDRVQFLPTLLQYTSVRVFHQQVPEPDPPNEIQFSGRDLIYLYGSSDASGLTVGEKDVTPSVQTESVFLADGSQQLGTDVESLFRDLRVAGADKSFLTYPYGAPDYDEKVAAGNAIDPATVDYV